MKNKYSNNLKMMFWAGLRGAVGVALAVGLTGENADALRTTVLVVVVLTVIIFGGTTARMLEVLGIRVGVEEEDGSSDEEALNLPLGGGGGGGRTRQSWGETSGAGINSLGGRGATSRRFAGSNGRTLRTGLTGGYEDSDNELEVGGYGMTAGEGGLSGYGSPSDEGLGASTPRTHGFRTASGLYGAPPRSANAALTNQRFPGEMSLDSSEGEDGDEDEDEEGEILPHSSEPSQFTVRSGSPTGDSVGGTSSKEGGREGMVFRDGQWFTALDERYLLPLFTNSVASRRHHARKVSRRANSGTMSPSLSPGGSGRSTPLGEGGGAEDGGLDGSGGGLGVGLGLLNVAGRDDGDDAEEDSDRAEVDSQNGKWKAGDSSRATFGFVLAFVLSSCFTLVG